MRRCMNVHTTPSLGMGVAAFALVLSMLAVSTPARAATISAGCSTGSLVSAVEQANQTTGATVVLAAGCTYDFDQAYADSRFALPAITSPMVIDGNAARFERDDDAPLFGFIHVDGSEGGELAVTNLTMVNGRGSPAAFVHNTGIMSLAFSEIIGGSMTTGFAAVLNTGFLSMVESTVSDHRRQLSGRSAVNNSGQLIVVGGTFTRNSVMNGGGAITNTGTATVSFTTFDRNGAAQSVGGAIWNDGGTLTVRDSTFTRHFALNGGAIWSDGPLRVERSYLADNQAGFHGGAIRYRPNDTTDRATIVNSTFHHNTARQGAAISSSGILHIEHATIADNVSTGGDPGALAAMGVNGRIGLRATILAGDDLCVGHVTSSGGNIAWPDRGDCPGDLTVADPRLQPPGDFGGATKTMPFFTGSAALNHLPGDGCPATDQRHRPRPAGPDGRCDAGAVEDQPPTEPGAPAVDEGGTVNQGAFQISWSASRDPEGLPITYSVQRLPSTGDGPGIEVGQTTSTSWSFTNEPEGRHRYGIRASDGTYLSSPDLAASEVIVVDRTPPVATAVADRPPDSPDGGGWYRAPVTVTLEASDPPLADGSAGSGVASMTPPQTFDASGRHTYVGTAVDAAGNESDPAALDVQVDLEPPVITFTACPEQLLLGEESVVAWDAVDEMSGLATPDSGDVAIIGDTVGFHDVSVTARDAAGHETTAVCTYQVVYDFDGFFAPLQNPPEINNVRAGALVPVSFSLGGDQGMGVLASDYPQSAPCADDGDVMSGAPTVAAAREFVYLAGSHRYTYYWQTDRAWSGTCRTFILGLDDGTHHIVHVQFR